MGYAGAEWLPCLLTGELMQLVQLWFRLWDPRLQQDILLWVQTEGVKKVYCGNESLVLTVDACHVQGRIREGG